MANVNAIRDDNHVPVALGVQSTDATATYPFTINPITGRLLTDNSGGGAGTVTSISIASANGFAGTSNADPATPILTISTTINSPVLAGNGTAIAAATTTGSGSTVVLNNGPTLIAPVLGTPTSGTLTNCTGLPIVGGTTGTLTIARGGTGKTTISALSIWVANSLDTLVEVAPGAGQSIRINGAGNAWEAFTPSAAVPTTITVANEATDTTCFIGFFTAATGDLGPKTNANLTFNSNTGVLTLVAPVLGTPTSGTLTNCTGLPIAGTTGYGTGVATALAINVGSAGAFVTFNGALGTPSSGTVTNLTGTASININGTVGATTPAAGTFTTLVASTGALPITATNSTDNASVQTLLLKGTRATPAANDELYESYNLNSSTGVTREFARMTVIGTTVTNTSEVGNIKWSTMSGGTLTARMILQATTLVPNANDGLALGTTALMWSDVFLASGAVINFNNGNVTLTHSAGVLTLGGTATLALGSNSITMTGSLAATGARVTKGWFTDLESTNMPTVGGTAILTSLTAPQFTTIELGAASDTTLARVSAGVISVEGVAVPTISSTSTITNKRNQPRIVSAASYTTDTGTSLDVSTTDVFVITAQAGALKFNNPSGTPVQGEKLLIRIKDNGTARALTYDTQFRASSDLALPTTTVISKTLYMGFIYNGTDTKWDLLAVLNNF